MVNELKRKLCSKAPRWQFDFQRHLSPLLKVPLYKQDSSEGPLSSQTCFLKVHPLPVTLVLRCCIDHYLGVPVPPKLLILTASSLPRHFNPLNAASARSRTCNLQTNLLKVVLCWECLQQEDRDFSRFLQTEAHRGRKLYARRFRFVRPRGLNKYNSPQSIFR